MEGLTMKNFTTAQRLEQVMKSRNMRQVDILNAAEPYCKKYGTNSARTICRSTCLAKLSRGRINWRFWDWRWTCRKRGWWDTMFQQKEKYRPSLHWATGGRKNMCNYLSFWWWPERYDYSRDKRDSTGQIIRSLSSSVNLEKSSAARRVFRHGCPSVCFSLCLILLLYFLLPAHFWL